MKHPLLYPVWLALFALAVAARAQEQAPADADGYAPTPTNILELMPLVHAYHLREGNTRYACRLWYYWDDALDYIYQLRVEDQGAETIVSMSEAVETRLLRITESERFAQEDEQDAGVYNYRTRILADGSLVARSRRDSDGEVVSNTCRATPERVSELFDLGIGTQAPAEAPGQAEPEAPDEDG